MKPPTGSLEAWAKDRSLHGAIDEVPTGTQGRLLLAGKHYVGPDVERALAAVQATRVVCLVERFELERRYDAYLEFLERDDRAIWWPVVDFHAPEVEQAAELVELLAARLDDGEALIVHCGAGIGRAGTIAAAVLIHQGHNVEHAKEIVRAARPMAGPQSDAQDELLAGLERRWASQPR